MELTDDDKKGMTPEEIAALEGDGGTANLAKTGEAELVEAAAIDAAAAEGTAPAVEGTAAEGELDEAALAEVLAAEGGEPVVEPDVAPPPASFRSEARDFKADRDALRAQVTAIDAKWGAGEMTDAERAAALVPLEDAKDALLRAQTRAETLREINEQTAQQTIGSAVVDVLNAAKKDGTIDYKADQKAAKQYDAFLQLLTSDPDNATKSATELANEAHKSMLALRGIAPKVVPAPPPPVPAAPAAPGRRNVPAVTLSGIPAAAPTGMENDALDKLSQLEGEDAEDYLASLPKAEQDRIMRAADAGSMQFQRAPRSRATRDSRAVHAERVE